MPKFVDTTSLKISSGKGGSGAVSYRREKFVPRGGPDGGNGGKGGDVVFVGSLSKSTLLDLSFTKKLSAKNGIPGSGRLKDGADGNNLTIEVPLGTSVYCSDSGNLLTDIIYDKQRVVILKGGRGGKGNTFFKSATNQTPSYSQPGEPGEALNIRLELKVIADVGLVGLPNAGKSSLLAKISSATPKVADYPFTTLTPQLGVVGYSGQSSFVVADLPGLIEGAHEGKGLGQQFLRHAERTKIIVHAIDCSIIEKEIVETPEIREVFSAKNIIDSYRKIQNELEKHSSDIESDSSEVANLTEKVSIIAFTKSDTLLDPKARTEIIRLFKHNGLIKDDNDYVFISSVTSEGIDNFINRLLKLVNKY